MFYECFVAMENHRMNISPHTSKFNYSKFIHQLISLLFHINFATIFFSTVVLLWLVVLYRCCALMLHL